MEPECTCPTCNKDYNETDLVNGKCTNPRCPDQATFEDYLEEAKRKEDHEII